MAAVLMTYSKVNIKRLRHNVSQDNLPPDWNVYTKETFAACETFDILLKGMKLMICDLRFKYILTHIYKCLICFKRNMSCFS